jgi:transketolase C-terminal domain/subunit
MLSQQKVRAAVVDCYCLPLDGDRLLDLIGRSGGTALVIEDNYGAGFGSAVADAAAEHGEVCVRSLYCQRIPKSTRTPEEEFELCGVSAAQAADQALALLRGQPVGA